MKKETAKRKIEMLDSYLQRKADYGESDHEAMMMAIKALERQDKIAHILDDCDLEAWEVLEMIKEVVNS